MEPESLVGRTAEDGMLEASTDSLPAALERPPDVPDLPGRAAIVAAGAALTGVSLLAGVALLAWALVSSFTDGADLLRGIAFAVGAVLVATHWGWVHVAELTSRGLSTRHHREIVRARQAWLASIEPYEREEVRTEVEPDGAIAIVTVRFSPVPRPGERFAFVREEVGRETHPDEEPTAEVAERVEELRRAAADATAAERERYVLAAGESESRALRGAETAAELEERRRTARALSERLNAHLREPPLDS